MGLFSRNRRTPEARAADSLAALQQILDRSGMTTAGVPVTPDSAMQQAAVWASIELVAGVGSSLPLDEFRKVNDDQVAVSLSALFADPDPDPSITAQAWRAQILRSAVARGNAYAELLGADMGTPTGAVTIHPDRVRWQWEKRASGGHAWQVYVDNVRRTRWPLGDLWHFPLFLQPGTPIGLSPVEYHRQAIGAALAAQKFGAQFFDGSNPQWVAKVTGNPGETGAKDLKEKIIAATSGNNDPLVISSEITLERVSIPVEDSQFLETQRYGTEEIARIFLGGFPELIGSAVSGGGSVTYANREQRMADFIALSLAPRYLVPLEAALSALVPRGRFVKHNVDALLRADLKGRYESYKLAADVADAMGAPLLTIDEMRRLENKPPLTPDQRAEFVRRPTPPPTAAPQ